MEQKQYEVLCGFMNHLTKGYVWYYDTPENRFKYTPNSIWLINPKTKEWAVELEKEGKLWWSLDFYRNFQRYFNMERPDFESFIKVWMEDVLNRGVSSTISKTPIGPFQMEDVLNRGVSSTAGHIADHWNDGIEDVLNRGVSSTGAGLGLLSMAMKDVLNHGKTIQ